MAARSKITAATLVMAAATFLSRIAGLIRDMVVARLFGAGLATDAFFLAFTIPNLLRRFFAEGSLTAAFVPIFSRVFHQRGEAEARQLANRCVTLLLLVMLAVVALGLLLSPWVVRAIGFGFEQTPGKLELTDQLNRIMFPYIGLIALLALLTGILNVRGHFFMPAVSPLFLNLSMILSALLLGQLFSRPIFALACGVLIGGLVQLLLQYPVLLRYRIALRPDFHFFGDPRVRQIVTLMLPGIAGVAIYQINIVVTRLLASFLPDGSLSYLYYGQRLFEFPQGIFVVSLAQAVLPMMSRQVAAGDAAGMRDSLRFSLVLVSLVALPATLGLMLCARPVYALFFLGGEFDSAALHNCVLALLCYAPGLLFVGFSRIAAQTFYALEDTRTPVRVSLLTLLVNLAGGLLLMGPFQFVGLALALTLAAIVNAGVLLVLLQRRVGPLLTRELTLPAMKSVAASLLMGIGVFWLIGQVDWLQPGENAFKSAILFLAVAGGATVYLALCWLFGVAELKQGWALLRSRGRRT